MENDTFDLDMEKFSEIIKEMSEKYSVDFFLSCSMASMFEINMSIPTQASYYMVLAAALAVYIERECAGDDRIAAELLKNFNLSGFDKE